MSSPVSVSSDAQNCGNFCNACTQARMTNASGVSLMPRPAASCFMLARAASMSVMSASSNCVTCGRLTQLACSRGPEIFWMRVSGLRSTGPNAAKSTVGTFGNASAPAAAAARPPPCNTCFTYALTSASVMRPLLPVPCTRARSTPSSRARRRMDGLACDRAKPGSSMTLDPRSAAERLRARAVSPSSAVAGAGPGCDSAAFRACARRLG